MTDAADETESLFARARAAIAEAERLAEESLNWRTSLDEGIRRMHLRAVFYPKTLQIYSPSGCLYRLTPLCAAAE